MVSPCTCAFDSKVFLEYFKVVLSFPTVILILAGFAFVIFKKDIKQLFPRVSKLPGGIELNPDKAAAVISSEIIEEDKRQENLRKAIDKLPNSEEKELIAQLQEASAEAVKQRLIANSLREQIATAQTETTMSIFPAWVIIDIIKYLKSPGVNPNQLTPQQLDSLIASIANKYPQYNFSSPADIKAFRFIMTHFAHTYVVITDVEKDGLA